MVRTSGSEIRLFKIFLILLYVVTLFGYIYYVQKGWDYYKTSFLERPRHQDYRVLKPGGITGHGFGVVGSAMMLIMLLYSVRKRSPKLSQFGPIVHWLDFHIYLGVWGPLFIILHSTLKIYGLVAISFYSMLAVAISGVLGRYLYLQIPRNIRGNEYDLRELRELELELSNDLAEKYGFSNGFITKIESLDNSKQLASRRTFFMLYGLVISDIKNWFELKKLRKDIAKAHNLTHKQVMPIIKLAKQKIKLKKRIAVLSKVQHIFHYWHVIHKPFAIIMLVIMFVHIAIAVLFGYRWIF